MGGKRAKRSATPECRGTIEEANKYRAHGAGRAPAPRARRRLPRCLRWASRSRCVQPPRRPGYPAACTPHWLGVQDMGAIPYEVPYSMGEVP